jgi:hypothetical protein
MKTQKTEEPGTRTPCSGKNFPVQKETNNIPPELFADGSQCELYFIRAIGAMQIQFILLGVNAISIFFLRSLTYAKVLDHAH